MKMTTIQVATWICNSDQHKLHDHASWEVPSLNLMRPTQRHHTLIMICLTTSPHLPYLGSLTTQYYTV